MKLTIRNTSQNSRQSPPVGGILLVWDPNSSTAYLINPATRTRTTLRLRGVPRAQYVTLAW